MKKIIFLVAIVIATSISIFGQATFTELGKMSKTEQEVVNLISEYGNSIIKRDTATVERVLADDFMEVNATRRDEFQITGCCQLSKACFSNGWKVGRF